MDSKKEKLSLAFLAHASLITYIKYTFYYKCLKYKLLYQVSQRVTLSSKVKRQIKFVISGMAMDEDRVDH